MRPLALSPDGSRLFALNTPDGHLEIFSIGPDGELSREASVPVGLEPIAVAARSDSEVWVVNHLSDSVSIVDVASSPPRVVRTLWVGDEPRDIVFAGPGHSRAFVTTAHRGQNHPDPATIRADLTKSGIGRADVWVFDADDPGAEPGGTPIAILTLFGDTPRALAASPDGSTVYAAVFHSGNGTTAVTEGLVCDGGETAPPCTVQVQVCDNANPPSCSTENRTMPGGLPGPRTNVDGLVQPETGLIVKYDQATGKWLDPLGRDWTPAVLFTLPDLDVFAIDALATPPVETASFAGVGTILFDMVVNPANGKLYVSNTEARNEVRFEGPGKFGGSTVRGHLHEARITVIDGSNVLPRHLNKHIDYSVVPSPRSVRKKSLATPLGMAVTSDGSTLYVAAFGSGKIGVFDTAALENDTFVPDHRDHIPVSGGGPSGLALDESRGKLYVLTRFDNAISVVDLGTRKETQHVPLNNPEPFRVVDGRPFLYDAAFTSSNGEASCSACHVFADLDSLAWDLGNPDDSLLTNPGPFIPPFGNPVFNNPPAVYRDFHPMKGPMTTQTLRGLAGHGPMHWRGDRTGGNDEISQQPDKGSFDEAAAFKKFNVAFEGLLGRARELTDEEMQRFTDFILEVVLPPNPIRALDGSLDAEQQAGRDFYFNVVSDTVFPCNGCHVLDPSQGFFGTDGRSTFEGESQFFKVPHLRNLYQKVGMFQRTGPQIRGFGFLHDGSIDTIFTFLHAPVFQFPDDATRRAVEAFLLAFDSNLAPIVGQQVTLTSTNGAAAGSRIDLLIARAQAGECDLVVKGVVAGEPRGAYLTAGGLFRTDRASDPLLTDAQVRALADTPGQELTYTCWPPGSAERAGVDRDGDTVFDGDELSAGTDPGSSTSVPGTAIVCSGGAVVEEAKLTISRNQEPSGDESLVLSGEFVLPTQDAIDPLAHGFEFRVDDKDGVPVFHRVIPRGRPSGRGLAGWKVNRKKTRWVYRDPRDVLEDGIRRVVVRDLSSQNPGTFRFRVRGRRGDFRVDPAALPLEVTVILGGPDEGALGVCGTRAFSASGGPPPSCSASPSGKRIRCR
ncbi:MAG: hypothetical protein KatS3mg076_2346 [Candidatus Binatia bacterium]|nr:MAG: hypothetical protein KatS3mg076_2346 [Candidatus Binatia bacterium]